MVRDNFAPLLIGAIVLVAIIAGISVTGGPSAARAEKRDDARLNDLRRLSVIAQCVANASGGLPEILEPTQSCGQDVPLTDKATGAPYVYKKLSDKSFKLCAIFERADLITRFDMGDGAWDGESNCFTMSYQN